MQKKLFSILALLLMAVTGAMAQTETLLTTITATAKEQASYSTANVATVSFSYTAGGSSAYLANWGWWGYGWSATVTAAEGYTITKCIFYDDANRTATDSEAPFVVETTEEDKTPRINGTPIDGGNMWSKGIKKIDVYGYAAPATVNITANSDGEASYWATYYNGTTSFTADANTTVYKAAMNGTSSLMLTEVADIPAGNAVILKSSSATITLTPAASTTADLSDNVLLGGTSVTAGYDAYTLSRGSAGTGTVGFYKFNGASLDGSKAHLEISSSSPAPARGFFGFGDDNTTAIEAPTATIIVEDGEIYDLMGRRIEGQPTRKGIYVKNGQKFIVK